MNIFIDESGIAIIPAAGQRNLFCVGALVVPDVKLPELSRQFAALKTQWGVPAGEIKGSELNDAQVASVIDLLIQCHSLFFVVATEMSVNDEVAMKSYQKVQAELFTEGLTEAAHPELRKQVTELRTTFERMHSQLFIQAVLLTDLLKKIIDLATFHFALTSPSEAGAFKWVIDGKDVTKTKNEAAWELIAGGLIQGRYLDSPGVRVAEGDYSHFERFLQAEQKWPAHLPPPNSENPVESGVILNLNKILYESLTFADSETTVGLQLADIATNAFRKAMMGRLSSSAYGRMGELMVGINRSPFEFHLFVSGAEKPSLDEYSLPLSIIKSRSRWPGFR